MKTIQNRKSVFYYNVVYQQLTVYIYSASLSELIRLTATLNLISKLLTTSQRCMAGS